MSFAKKNLIKDFEKMIFLYLILNNAFYFIRVNFILQENIYS